MAGHRALTSVGRSVLYDLVRPLHVLRATVSDMLAGRGQASRYALVLAAVLLLLAAFELVYLHVWLGGRVRESLYTQMESFVRDTVRDAYQHGKLGKDFVATATALAGYKATYQPQLEGVLGVAEGFERRVDSQQRLRVAAVEVAIVAGLAALVVLLLARLQRASVA